MRFDLHQLFLGFLQAVRGVACFRRVTEVEQHLLRIFQVTLPALAKRALQQFVVLQLQFRELRLQAGHLLALLVDGPRQFADQSVTGRHIIGNGWRWKGGFRNFRCFGSRHA
jgi:hypothetical protein